MKAAMSETIDRSEVGIWNRVIEERRLLNVSMRGTVPPESSSGRRRGRNAANSSAECAARICWRSRSGARPRSEAHLG